MRNFVLSGIAACLFVALMIWMATPPPGPHYVDVNGPGPPTDDKSIQAIAAHIIPDPRFTPGAINPDVTQENIDSTICVPGFTKTIRPPAR